MAENQERLPRTGPGREALRQKGQFWTPQWVARAMVQWATGHGANEVFDPAVGSGAFFLAAKQIGAESGRPFGFSGREIDREALEKAKTNGLTTHDITNVELRDFVLDPPNRLFGAIVANPPYIRHHRLSVDTKANLKRMAATLYGLHIDGRAGFHVYFLLRALSLLAERGRLAFIIPADTFEGVFATDLWARLTERYRLCAVATFEAAATPFPGVDTNAVVVFMENSPPMTHVTWLRVGKESNEFELAAVHSFVHADFSTLKKFERPMQELLATGVSRPPQLVQINEEPLGQVMRCVRGIATGNNDFFLMTDERATKLGIGPEFLVPVLSKTRFAPGDIFTDADFAVLRSKGLPVWLLSLDGRPENMFPTAVQEYLRSGVELGIDDSPLISTRRPWYRMEKRAPPPFLFAYLGRRHARFIRNDAKVFPLTGFLCVYAREGVDEVHLWDLLRSDHVRDNLARVGKSYGSGAIKVEPRALERTPVPAELIRDLLSTAPPDNLFSGVAV